MRRAHKREDIIRLINKDMEIIRRLLLCICRTACSSRTRGLNLFNVCTACAMKSIKKNANEIDVKLLREIKPEQNYNYRSLFEK